MVAIVMLLCFVTEPTVERKVAPIDWAGAVCLTSGMSTLLWIVLDGSRQGSWSTLIVLGVSVVLLVLFVIRERMAADPILPMDLMTRADDRGVTGRQLSGRRHPVWARYVRPAVHPGSAGRGRDLGGPCAHAAVPGVGGQCRGGCQGRGSLRVSPRGHDRLGLDRGGEPDSGGRR